MRIDDDIWNDVRPHQWKWQVGRIDTVGIIWHATRSGIPNRTGLQEYYSALNWFKSPNNVVRDSAGNPWYGGLAHYIVGGGRVCRVLPEEYVPRFSAGTHDFRAISIEVGQGTNDTPYDPRDIELCHELAEELSSRYGFHLGRIPFIDGDNRGWPGEVGHEDTAQGRQSGKSDPGPLFWQSYMAEGKNEMNEKERRLMLLMASVLAGHPNGEEFKTVEEALPFYESYEANDLRFSIGLGQTQALLNKHINEHPAGGSADSDHKHEIEVDAPGIVFRAKTGGKVK